MHKIIKGDDVIVIAGIDVGKVGKVIGVSSSSCGKRKVLVSGVNMRRKRAASSKNGKVADRECFFDVSNVAFFDKETRSRAKLGVRFLENGSKVRFVKMSNRDIVK
jgi:large subunit ribosomal protein L24